MDFAQGFLSDPFDEVRATVRSRYGPWRELLLLVNGECVKAQHAIEVNPLDPRQLLAAVLFARTLASTQAGVLLLEHGLVSQARTMLRTAIETLFQLGAIYRDPNATSKIIASHDADRRTVADRMLRWKSERLRDAIRSEISEDELLELKASKAPGLNVYDLACKAEMEEWYLTLYSLLSFPAHGALSDLTSHVIEDGDGVVHELRSDPEIEEQESSWGYAIEIQLKAADALGGIFGSPQIDTARFKAALSRLANKERG
jgi:hypothetical protein